MKSVTTRVHVSTLYCLSIIIIYKLYFVINIILFSELIFANKEMKYNKTGILIKYVHILIQIMF